MGSTNVIRLQTLQLKRWRLVMATKKEILLKVRVKILTDRSLISFYSQQQRRGWELRKPIKERNIDRNILQQFTCLASGYFIANKMGNSN